MTTLISLAPLVARDRRTTRRWRPSSRVGSERGACGKIAHASEVVAMRHLRQLALIDERADRLRVYCCDECDGAWHVGHASRSQIEAEVVA